MLRQCVAKEVNAIDAEDSKNRTSDDRRLLQVLKAVTNPRCSYAKYSTGNAATLRDIPAQADPPVEVRVARALPPPRKASPLTWSFLGFFFFFFSCSRRLFAT
jgi:hypothetical protein